MAHVKNTITFEEIIADDLRDDQYVIGYLNSALQDEDPRHFLLALSQVAKARNISMSDIAKQLGVNRRALYYALSQSGNPTWNTLHGLLSALGFNIQLAPKKSA